MGGPKKTCALQYAKQARCQVSTSKVISIKPLIYNDYDEFSRLPPLKSAAMQCLVIVHCSANKGITSALPLVFPAQKEMG
jgi:hypothetical protein